MFKQSKTTTSTSKEEPSFTLVTSRPSNPNSAKSSLYYLVQELVQENHSLIVHETIVPLHNEDTGRKAFLIELSPPTNSCITEEAGSYKRSHLTFDFVYALDGTRKSYGYTPVHYTEERVCVNGDQITIRVYFDSLGRYSHCLVKKNEILQKEISFCFCQLIEENYKRAVPLLEELLVEKRKRYLDIFNKANELDIQLGKMFQGAKRSIFNFERYKMIALEFIEVIDKKNLYNETEVDGRGVCAKENLDNLALQLSLPQTKEKDTRSNKEVIEDEDIIDTSKPTLPKTQVVNRQYIEQQLTEQLQEQFAILLAIQTHPHDVATYIKQHKLVKSIQLLMLQLPQNIPVCLKIDKHINSVCPLTTRFEEAFTNGNLEEVTLLWPYVQHFINPVFYFDFLIKIIHEGIPIKNKRTNSKQIESNLVAVFNFLFENSQAYRDILYLQNIEIMFEENCGDSILKIGLAALAYLRQYNEIFKLLLEQGLGGTGIIYNDYPVILSKYLTAISEEQELNYVVDLLVKYNICLENSNQVVHSEKDIKALLSKKRFYKIKQTLTSCGCYSVTTKSKTKETASTAAAGFIDSKQLALDWLKPFDSCLEVICCMHHINVTAITHLAEHSSLESIVKSLSILCNNPGINTRLISSTSFTMSLKEEKIVDSTTLAPSLPNLMINPQLTANPPIIFENNCYEWILYPNQSTSDSINISTVICNLIRLLHQKIASNQHNIFTKDGLYEKLATKAMTLKGEISAFYARSCLCLLLLASSYSSMSNQQTSKKLMQMFGIIGNACFVEERFYMAANNYTNACIIGYYSLLTNTPSFTRCKQYLEASAKKPVEACKNFLLFSRVLSERVATVQNPVSTNASTSSFANKKQGCYCKS